MKRLIILATVVATPVVAALFLLGGSASASTTTGTWTLYPPQAVTTSYKAVVQQPINPDNSSSWPVKRGVIPVQFSLLSAQTVGPIVFQSICSDNTVPSTCTGGETANDFSYLSFAPSGILTFDEITKLSANYNFTFGNCHGGSLRWSVRTDPTHSLFIYYGAYPNFTDCTTNNQSGVNMINLSDLRYDTSQYQPGGTFYDTYTHAKELMGIQPITAATLVLDSGWGGDQIATVSNVTVNDNTFVPQTPGTGPFAPTCTLPDAKIAIGKVGGTDPTPTDEVTAIQAADTGSFFRKVDCKYIYNLDVSSLSGVGMYNVFVNIGEKNLNSPGIFGLR